jgi:predicted AlkP superfamily phosphohydrolase/phosphomutase
LFDSLRAMTVPAAIDWEIVVVNNACTDTTDEVIRDYQRYLPIRTLYEAQPGLSNARNCALATVSGRHTLWTDDDVTVDPEWLSVYERAFRFWPERQFFGGPVEAGFTGTPPDWIDHALVAMPEAYACIDPTAEFAELGQAGSFLPFGANMAFRAGALDGLRFEPSLGRQPGALVRGFEEIRILQRVVERGDGLWLPPARVTHWIGAARQTRRYLYDFTFSEGFLNELIDYPGNGNVAADTLAPAIVAESFRKLECELTTISTDPAVWLPYLRESALADGRSRCWELLPDHYRTSRKRRTPPLLVIGLDGFEMSVAERMIAAGGLPNIERLMQRSARYALDHGDALPTGLAWEQFSTGKSPDDYRRWSAVDLDVDTYQARQVGTRNLPFLHEIDAHAVIFDVPYFDLAAVAGGSGMTSWGAHDPGVPRQARPMNLAGEIDRRFGGYPANEWIYGFVWPDPDRAEEMGRRLEQAVDQRTRISRWLLTERFPEWDVAMVTAGELHSATEGLWHGIDPRHLLHGVESAAPAGRGLEAVYEATDRMVGELVEELPAVNLLVFSMHGMGANHSDVASMLLLSELLFRDNFGMNAFTPDPNWSSGAERIPMLGRGAQWSEVIGNRIRIPDAVWSLLGSDPVAATRESLDSNLAWMPAARYQPAWHRMDAFALPSFYDGRVRVNLAGRERHGRVPLEHYDACCARVIELLNECRDYLTGEEVVDGITRCRHSNPLDLAPSDFDLQVRWRRPVLGLEHPRLGRIGPAPLRRPGGHGGPGVAWLCGKSIEPGDYGTASSFDVAPTVLGLLGERRTGMLSGHPLSCVRPGG